jgi:hypothetical protein
MNSHDILKEAIEGVGVKRVAAELNVSSGLIYKWCQSTKRREGKPPPGEDQTVKNPLDRVVDLFALTQDPRIINYICHQSDGFFVPNGKADTLRHVDQSLFEQTQKMLSDFSLLLSAITRSTIDDRSIDLKEAGEIRAHWEDLKRFMEMFVVRAEKGEFEVK